MSVLVESSMGELNEDRRGIYPLFQKGAKPKETKPTKDNDESKFLKGQTNIARPKPKGATVRTGKRSKASGASSSAISESPNTPSQNHAELLEVDPNNGRRKRRKIASLDGKGQHREEGESPHSLQTNDLPQQTFINGPTLSDQQATSTFKAIDLAEELLLGGNVETKDQNHESAAVVRTFPRNDDIEIQSGLDNVQGADKWPVVVSKDGTPSNVPASDGKPRKVLKLNPKTGTFGSPPRKTVLVPDAKAKRITAQGKKQKSKLVTIRYDPSLGPKIDQILNSTKSDMSLPKPIQAAAALKTTKPAPTKPLKTIHPLFIAKLAPKTSPRKSPNRDSAVVDLTLISSPSKSRATNSRISNTKTAVLFSGFGNTSKLVKFPGALEPVWPWKGMLHVRGNDPNIASLCKGYLASTMQERQKKSKGNATRIPATEDVIEILASNLRVGEIADSNQDVDLDEYPIVPPSLRTVVKHNESGASIQKRIRKELHARLQLQLSKQPDESSSEDEIRLVEAKPAPIHPALAKCYASIATSLSAFDKGQCENQVWTSKYAPQRAAEVLQAGEEAIILKGWLTALTVNAVTAAGASSLPTKTIKRKRKTKKLDGFVVSSDEDDFIQNEASEQDTDLSPSKNKKTYVKQGLSKETGKPNNAILMSGPHGCGKTAAVYAVAKELGFEVFEINSSSRRSGKDITDKVGDMTRNHLVQHSTIRVPVELDADEKRIDDALADDLKSGRQGTMNSFFKSQPPKSKPKPMKLSKEAPIDSKGSGTSRQPPREQKQSLILIEEVDILYKEDSQFWPTIINLIQSSKRPIVMTCNDESLVDTSLFALHGVLRFTPQPADLAVDYMLIVAACEGHVLKRGAVQSLYETRGLDLRASLTDLNYWCQFGVGSVRGGLDWIYSRFPRGSDVDTDGNIIRVVSDGTYQAGMGCLSRDYLESHLHHLDIEEEMLRETWNSWQLDASDWQANLNMGRWTNRQHLPAALSTYEEFAETMSDADLCSHGTMATDLDVTLDTSTLKPTPKALDDYVLPFGILKASEVADSSSIRDVAFWMRSRARAYLQIDQHIKHDLDVPIELDRLSESGLMQLIQKQATSHDERISRADINYAFESISTAEKPYVWSNSTSLISVFSGTLGPIVQDAAPYVRSIVAYDARLAQERIRMSNLLSEGGKSGKRMRRTRAAMSALEGGVRKETRREKYFNDQLNPYLVSRTGMQSWIDASIVQTEAEREAAAALKNRRASNGSIETERTDNTTDVES